jgi:hypothetical protein
MRDDGKIFGTFQLSVSLKRFFKFNSIRGTFVASKTKHCGFFFFCFVAVFMFVFF